MTEFNTSLLREKFIIRDAVPPHEKNRIPVVALSNRLVLPLVTSDGTSNEEFVVRAQNMHTCARFGAHICREFQENGPLLTRRKEFDWKYAYLAVTKGYEKKWNPNRWVAVYHKGRVMFEDGEGEVARHPFLDIIEQCDARNRGDYERAMRVAEDAFKQAGKLVTIEHDSNIALVMNLSKQEGKCGVIVRGPNHTTTFNFTARPKAGREVQASHCLSAAAAFLEGVQLAFFVGMTQEKVKYELISNASEEARQARDAGEKIGRLNGAVQQFENLFEVIYRPDRPNMSQMIDDSKEFARKLLAKDLQKKIDEGDADTTGWVM
jgi:hypothetical protein